jgi:ABC-type antimicrobial peptide transport system permease subunit
VDPALQLDELQSAADVERQARRAAGLVALAVTLVTASVLLLSATGIYAMMSFTVARRRREIGIRAALGADRQRIIAGVFARASAQLGAGVLGGLALAVVVDRAAGSGPLAGKGLVVLPAVAVLMIGIGLLAALGPARRGLAVQPTEALREE